MYSLAKEIKGLQEQCVGLQEKIQNTVATSKQPHSSSGVKHASGLADHKSRYLSAALRASEECEQHKKVSSNPIVVSLNLLEELNGMVTSMTELHEVVDAQIDSLEKGIEHKGGLIKQQEEIHEANLKQLTALNQSSQKDLNLVFTLEAKCAKYSQEVQAVKTQMNQFMDKHFSVRRTSKHKLAGTDMNVKDMLSQSKFVSMRQLYNDLLTLAVEKPDAPYLTVGLQHWPQHVDLLVRFGIAVRNPRDGNQIKLANTYV